MKYNPNDIEARWQKFWAENQTFAAENGSDTRGEAELSKAKQCYNP